MSEFIQSVLEKAKKLNKTILLPEFDDERTIRAAEKITKEGIAKVILLGAKEETAKVCPDVDLTGIQFVVPEKDDHYEDFIAQFTELRKHKGMTPEKAREVMKDPTSYGMMMLKNDLADGLVSGAVHSTADTLRPALQIIRTKKGAKLVSAFFLIIVPDCKYGENGVFVFADTALNELPDAEAISEIAINSAESFRTFTGAEPVVAMCSYSSQGSAHSELTEKVALATKLAKEKAPELKLDGELQIDAALVPETGKRKAPNSTVQGGANVLIFSNLDTGNIAYKLVQYLAKAEAYGPILQGIAKPVNDLSRGCSSEDIVGVVAMTALQAAANK